MRQNNLGHHCPVPLPCDATKAPRMPRTILGKLFSKAENSRTGCVSVRSWRQKVMPRSEQPLTHATFLT
jgi:hypothetical protein